MIVDTSLLPGNPASLPEPPARPSTPGQRALKALAYVGIFVGAFLLFFFLKLPDSLVSNAVLNTLNTQTPYSWRAEKMGVGLFLFPHLRAEQLTIEGRTQNTIPPITFDTIKLYPSILSLIPITGSVNPRVSFKGRAYEADIEGSARGGGSPSIEMEASNVNLAKLKPLQDQRIDLQGLFTKIAADLDIENGDPSRLDGTFELQGKNLVIDPASFQIPMALPILDLGVVDIRGKATKGKVELDRFQVGAPGKDLQITLTGEIKLSRNLPASATTLRVVLKPSEKVLQAVPSLKSLLDTLATPQPGGAYAMRFSGTLGNIGLPRADK